MLDKSEKKQKKQTSMAATYSVEMLIEIEKLWRDVIGRFHFPNFANFFFSTNIIELPISPICVPISREQPYNIPV